MTRPAVRSIAPPLPPLATLDQPPSWVNNHSRIDRSACAELRASWIWPGLPFAMLNSSASPGELEAFASAHITAAILAHHLRFQHPRSLRGDNRTSRANVMLGPFDKRTPPTGRRHQRIHQNVPAFNPNKGALQTKTLPLIELDPAWSQMIRVERWRLHDRLAQHFLICPGGPPNLNPTPLEPRASRHLASPSPTNIRTPTAKPLRPKPCLRRAGKLFIPLATPLEISDARLALAWIARLHDRFAAARKPIPHDLLAMRAKLVHRYARLLPPYALLCRHCLGLRYGSTWSLRDSPSKRARKRNERIIPSHSPLPSSP